MRNITILFVAILLSACSANKYLIENKKDIVKKIEVKEVVRKKATTANATKNDRGYLIGFTNREAFNDASYQYWFNDRYSTYKTDQELIAKLKPIINDFTIKGFMGTWCGDSKRETPRFYKILDETGFDQDYFELVTVGRNKKTPNNLQEGFNIIRVPTFIFYKDGEEVGRFVEYPRETLEKDIFKILTGAPYKHSYDRSK